LFKKKKEKFKSNIIEMLKKKDDEEHINDNDQNNLFLFEWSIEHYKELSESLNYSEYFDINDNNW